MYIHFNIIIRTDLKPHQRSFLYRCSDATMTHLYKVTLIQQQVPIQIVYLYYTLLSPKRGNRVLLVYTRDLVLFFFFFKYIYRITPRALICFIVSYFSTVYMLFIIRKLCILSFTNQQVATCMHSAHGYTFEF